MYPHFELADLVMAYLLGVTVAGLRFGRGSSVLTVVLNVVLLNLIFVPHRFTFAVSEVQYLVTFAVMLIISLVIGSLMASLRNTLLASISHDLRTPLAAAGSALASRGEALDEATRSSLARAIETKAREMTGLVSNILDLMRFDSGRVELRRDAEQLEDLIGPALHQSESHLAERLVDVRLPIEWPAVDVDATLRSGAHQPARECSQVHAARDAYSHLCLE